MPKKIQTKSKAKNIKVTAIEHTFDSTLTSIKGLIQQSPSAFYHVNICHFIEQFHRWQTLFPRIKPYYAVKCQPDPYLIAVLGRLGTGFDCASKKEIQVVRKTLQMSNEKVSTDIIFANPFKFKKDMQFANRVGVKFATFDTESELIRLSQHWETVKLLLRIAPEREYKTQCHFGTKYGAVPNEIPFLLERAKDLGLDIVGVSFHVGSGCQEMEAFIETVHYCASIMNEAREIGFRPYILDIGGGFPGYGYSYIHDSDKSKLISDFEDMTQELNLLFESHFPADAGYVIIAEPGRFFATGGYTLATEVIGKKSLNLLNSQTNRNKKLNGITNGKLDKIDLDLNSNLISSVENMNHFPKKAVQTSDTNGMQYIINDGLYNSFNNIVMDHALPVPCGLFNKYAEWSPITEDKEMFISNVFGPTCDGVDCVLQEVKLPELQMNDWLIWPDMGAYTFGCGSEFNGIIKPKCHYEICKEHEHLILPINPVECNKEIGVSDLMKPAPVAGLTEADYQDGKCSYSSGDIIRRFNINREKKNVYNIQGCLENLSIG